MGVHFTRPGKLAKAGLLTTRALQSPTRQNPGRTFCVYLRAECEKSYTDYEEALRAGGTGRRDRDFVGERPSMLRQLAREKHAITFGDAISTGEAAEILGVHWTFPPRLAQDGHIVGRILINGRNARSRCWIFSRSSCAANRALAQRLQDEGKKKGRKRYPLSIKQQIDGPPPSSATP